MLSHRSSRSLLPLHRVVVSSYHLHQSASSSLTLTAFPFTHPIRSFSSTPCRWFSQQTTTSSAAEESTTPPHTTETQTSNSTVNKKEKRKEKKDKKDKEKKDKIDPSTLPYKEQRLLEFRQLGLLTMTENGETFAYPNDFTPDITAADFLSTYASLDKGTASTTGVVHRLCGRIFSRRDASNKLIFLDLVCESGVKVQVMVARDEYNLQTLPNLPAATTSETTATTLNYNDYFRQFHRVLHRGDLIGVEGIGYKTGMGEITISAKLIKLLAPSLHEIPAKLTDPNTRFRQRYLDMLVNSRVTQTFQIRAQVLSTLRSFFSNRGFVEVETPILWPSHGGATARPFITNSRAFGQNLPLFMRIAPELFLKELVIGGLGSGVFEISKVFRNEGIDPTHNPEFTTIEVYKPFANYHYMKETTEVLFREIVKKINGGSLQIKLTQKKSDAEHCSPDSSAPSEEQELMIDFAPPFRTIDIMSALQEKLKRETPLPDPNNDASLAEYLEICKANDVPVKAPFTVPRVLDKLIGHYLEPECIQPTFLMNHPVSMSPLARSHTTQPGLTERFELFINGQEYCNAYSELNDPAEQLRRMTAQAKAQDAGDDEAHPVDKHFCTALEYGLPPTAGWGMGIDRLIMLLSNSPHIREVLLFPLVKPDTVHDASTNN